MTPAQRPRDYAEKLFAGVSDEVTQKVLWGNAAKVYGL
jgi:predicted TIM-barrel fold metal-dependent hydrolase